MATIISEVAIAADANTAWALLRDFGQAHRAFPGVLTACRRDGDVRTVTFANGMEVREQLVTLDEARRRIAYAVVGGRFSQHSASMQVIADADGTSRFLWVSDFLPEEAQSIVRGLVEQGTEAFCRAAAEQQKALRR